jgi:hypothetical protein
MQTPALTIAAATALAQPAEAAAPAAPTTAPRIGQPWPGQGGIYAGLVAGTNGSPDQHVVLALTFTIDRRNHADSTAWAASVTAEGHSDFGLPTRDESALLYANVRGLIQHDGYWYWTSTPGGDGYAWTQHFRNGLQLNYVTSFKARALAVRRFNASVL